MAVPKFSQLVYLHLIYDMTQHFRLMQFLKSAPILEMLSIRVSLNYIECCDSTNIFSLWLILPFSGETTRT